MGLFHFLIQEYGLVVEPISSRPLAGALDSSPLATLILPAHRPRQLVTFGSGVVPLFLQNFGPVDPASVAAHTRASLPDLLRCRPCVALRLAQLHLHKGGRTPRWSGLRAPQIRRGRPRAIGLGRGGDASIDQRRQASHTGTAAANDQVGPRSGYLALVDRSPLLPACQEPRGHGPPPPSGRSRRSYGETNA